MISRLSAVSVLVPDYDSAIAFYVGAVGFDLLEDTDLGGAKRWVRVGPKGAGSCLLLARAPDPTQAQSIGCQAGGRVFLFFETDDFAADFDRMTKAGVKFREAPRHEAYGTVAVFEDPYGNCFDLIEPRRAMT
jgi:predicted enzyme related to lactoylglutathione lyase